jgi:GrpB-like predicted nucleotidyltransferase (UPF0157 family)
MFARQAVELREALGAVALRIDHVGSTAIPQLAAKPIIDGKATESLGPLVVFQFLAGRLSSPRASFS